MMYCTPLIIEFSFSSLEMDGDNDLQALIGTCSLTLLGRKRIAEELGLRNGEFLKCYVDGNRLIVERKYRSALTMRTKVLEMDHEFD
jgi:hypothetical protein